MSPDGENMLRKIRRLLDLVDPDDLDEMQTELNEDLTNLIAERDEEEE